MFNANTGLRNSRHLLICFVLASAFWLTGSQRVLSQKLKTSWSIPDLMTWTVMPDQCLLYARYSERYPGPGSLSDFYNGYYVENVYSQYGDLKSSAWADFIWVGQGCMMSADRRENIFTWGGHVYGGQFSSSFFCLRSAQYYWNRQSFSGSPKPLWNKYSVSADATVNTYCVGKIESEELVCLTKLDTAGTMQWKTNIYYAICVAADDDGNAYVTGNSADLGAQPMVLAKYNTGGELQWETKWGASSNDSVCAIAVAESNTIYVVGLTYGVFDGQTNSGGADMFLSRFTSDGTRLWSRIWGERGDEPAPGIAVHTNHDVYVCGGFRLSRSVVGACITTFDTNGTIKDILARSSAESPSFSNIEVDNEGSVYVSDGRTIDKLTVAESSIAGTISYGGVKTGEVLIVVSTDPQFGRVSFSYRIPVPGSYSLTNLPAGRFYVAAVLTKPGRMFENVGVIDPWGIYTAGGPSNAAPIYLTLGSATTGVDMALSESRNPLARPMIPLDFDGDGRSDLGVLRPSTMTWYIAAQGGIGNPFECGSFGDKPIPADYDGDGKSEQAVFRPSTVTWYVGRRLGVPPPPFQFGAIGDIPIPADYDGDKIADVAVFRPSTMQWFIFGSSAGPMPVYIFGGPGDIPIPADYDGDGKADFAIFRPSTVTWYIYGTSHGPFAPFQYGAYGDLPVPGDYDGDGIVDYAVFRPSNNMWFFWCSTAGGSFGPHQFGTKGDIPLR